MKLERALVAYGLKDESIDELGARYFAAIGHPSSIVQQRQFLSRAAMTDERFWLCEQLRHQLRQSVQNNFTYRISRLSHFLDNRLEDIGLRTSTPAYDRFAQLADEYRRLQYEDYHHGLELDRPVRMARVQRMNWLYVELVRSVSDWSPLV